EVHQKRKNPTSKSQRPIFQALITPLKWVRDEFIRHGSYSTINLVIPISQSPQIPPLMVVNSCDVSHSTLLMNKNMILDELQDCPEIIRCFGDSFTFEKGQKLYNVLL
ncbi:unnamed protein product, partial [Ilex paraguariensis]